MMGLSGILAGKCSFKGNIGEPTTLKQMIDNLKSKRIKDKDNKTIFTKDSNSLVVMDAGIASQENIDYLIKNNYEYLVVSRKKDKQFDNSKACDVKVDKDNNSIVFKCWTCIT